jgi:hypothetical protein
LLLADPSTAIHLSKGVLNLEEIEQVLHCPDISDPIDF